MGLSVLCGILSINLTEWRITWEMGHRGTKDAHTDWASKRAQQGKAHVTKADHLNPIPRTHIVERPGFSVLLTTHAFKAKPKINNKRKHNRGWRGGSEIGALAVQFTGCTTTVATPVSDQIPSWLFRPCLGLPPQLYHPRVEEAKVGRYKLEVA